MTARDAPAGAIHLAADEDALLACVHCGFCLPACPTYRVLGDENDSPRGRIHLMRALVEGRVAASGAFETHIGRCLGCLACETVCPAGVEYGALLERARADLRETAPGVRGRARKLLAGAGCGLLAGAAGGPLFALLRAARSSGLAAAGGRLLPGRAGLAARLVDATRPPASSPRPAAGGALEEGHRGAGAEDEEAAGGPGAEAVDGTRRGPGAGAEGDGRTFTLLEGCVMRGLFGHVRRAARSALAAHGYREVAAPGQGCCGALHAHAGLPETARRLAVRNLEAFERGGADRIAVDSAGCGAALREYPRWLAGDPALAARAGRLAERVRDVTELLADPPPDAPALRLEGRVGYDAPCHLHHAQRVVDAPLSALRRIEGLEVVPLPSAAECCGGAGTYNLLHPGISRRVLERKVEEIAAGRYDWIATGNPGCIMQIGAGLRHAGVRVPVVHPVELFRRAGARGPAAVRSGVEETSGGARTGEPGG